MKSFKRIIALVLFLFLSLSVTGKINYVNAETHSHTESCYLGVKHVHEGKDTVRAGCYMGSSYTKECSVPMSVTYWAKASRATGAPAGMGPSSVYGIEFKVGCTDCGWQDTTKEFIGYGTSTRPDDEWCATKIAEKNASITSHHSTAAYNVSCGKDETSLYKPEGVTQHTHEGVETTRSGCYQGASTAINTCTGLLDNIDSEDVGTCDECGGTLSVTYGICSSCGESVVISSPYTSATPGILCCGSTTSSNVKYTNGNWYHNTAIYKYALSCGKVEGALYDKNGVKIETLCDKVVTKLSPKK